MTCLACDGGGGSAGTDDLLCAACNGTGEVAVPAPQTNCAPECVRGWHAEGCPNAPGGVRRGPPTPDSSTAKRCVQCGQPVEGQRECYAHPTCYACLPPPEPLPIAWPRSPLGNVDPPEPRYATDICETHCRALEARTEPWRCPLCFAARLAQEARVAEGEAMLALESAEHRLAAAQAEAGRLREAVRLVRAALEAHPDSDLAALAAATLRQARAADDEHEEAARLRDALRRHGRHDADCGRLKPAYYVAGRPVGHGDCTCGFDAVEAGETLLAPESAEHRLAAAQAEAGRLREAVEGLVESYDLAMGPESPLPPPVKDVLRGFFLGVDDARAAALAGAKGGGGAEPQGAQE